MITRRLLAQLYSLLAEYPAVALLGPRQVGKTTLALEIAETTDAVYLDLESVADRARLSDAPARVDASFYRASGGAEIDLVLTFAGKKSWAIEIKRSLDPKPAKGFHSACAYVKPQAQFVVYPGEERFSISTDIEAVSVDALAQEIAVEA